MNDNLEFPKVITSIKSKGGTNKVIIFFETGEYLHLNLDLVYKFQLAKGVSLDEQYYNNIQKEFKIVKGKRLAHSFCSKQMKSEKDIADLLKRKQYLNDEIQIIIDFLKEFGLLDDAKFAQMAFNYFQNRKHYGTSRIRLELLKKGISNSIIESVINDNPIVEEIELERAKLILSKKQRLIQSKNPQQRRTYVLNSLKTSGFNKSIIRKILDDNFSENNYSE